MGGTGVRAALLIAFVVVCAVFGARTLIEPDTIGLALAVDQQDVRLHQPPPPGFVLYVWLAQFIDAWIDNPWIALRVVALATLAAAAVLTSQLSARMGNAHVAPLALLVFLSSPLVLFHGMTATSFPADALISALTAFLCVRALERRATVLRRESYVIGLVCGLRANALVFALPLWLWTVARAALTPRERFLTFVAWGAGTLCWLLPQVEHAGGLGRYVDASWAMLVANADTAPRGGAWDSLLNRVRILFVVGLCGLGVARLLLLAVVRVTARPKAASAVAEPVANGQRGASHEAWREPGFWMLWLLPALAWTLLCSLPAPGALLGFWPALCVVFATACRTEVGRRVGVRVALVAIVLDVALFFLVPVSQLRGAPGDVLADATFSHERTLRAQAAAPVETLRAAKLDARQTLFLSSDPGQRVLAYVAPEMHVLHADVRRPEALLAYRGRRARAVAEIYEVAGEVRWVVLAGSPNQFSRAPNPLLGAAWVRESIDGMQIVHVGSGPIDAWFVPDHMGDAPRQLRLVRGLPPSDPNDGALERAHLDLYGR